MPLYEYECNNCTLIQEELRNEDERDNPVYCDKCNQLCERIVMSKTFCKVCNSASGNFGML